MFIRNANPGATRCRGLPARQARARAHVLLARQPGHLLRRRAGLRRRRRRPGRAAGHVPGPVAPVQRPIGSHRGTTAPGTTTTSVRTRRRWTITSTRASAVRGDRRPRRPDRALPGAARRRAPAPATRATPPGSTRTRGSIAASTARVRRRGQQLRERADGARAHLGRARQVQEGLRQRREPACARARTSACRWTRAGRCRRSSTGPDRKLQRSRRRRRISLTTPVEARDRLEVRRERAPATRSTR